MQRNKKTKSFAKATRKDTLDNELRESQIRWRKEGRILTRIVQLERQLGYPPTLLDLFCAGFTRAELASISDLLPWLTGTTTLIPDKFEMEVHY